MDPTFECFSDILPDPPDGTPVIELITGKVITLSWKKPKRLDPSIGTHKTFCHIERTMRCLFAAVIVHI